MSAAEPIEMTCPECQATITVRPRYPLNDALVIATIGLGVVFDPPGYKPPKDWLPDSIQCPRCRKLFT